MDAMEIDSPASAVHGPRGISRIHHVTFPGLKPTYMDFSPTTGDVSMTDATGEFSLPSVHYSPNSPSAMPPRSILKKRTREYDDHDAHAAITSTEPPQELRKAIFTEDLDESESPRDSMSPLGNKEPFRAHPYPYSLSPLVYAPTKPFRAAPLPPSGILAQQPPRKIISPKSRLSQQHCPPVGQLYPQLSLTPRAPAQSQALQAQETAPTLRYIGGRMINVVSYVPAILSTIWRFGRKFLNRRAREVTGEVVAVQTEGGHKRRCVSREDIHIPGEFPTTSPATSSNAQTMAADHPAEAEASASTVQPMSQANGHQTSSKQFTSKVQPISQAYGHSTVSRSSTSPVQSISQASGLFITSKTSSLAQATETSTETTKQHAPSQATASSSVAPQRRPSPSRRTYKDVLRSIDDELADREKAKAAARRIAARRAANPPSKNDWKPRQPVNFRDDSVEALIERARRVAISTTKQGRAYKAKQQQLEEENAAIARDTALRAREAEEAAAAELEAQQAAERKKQEEEEEKAKLATLIRPLESDWTAKIAEKMATNNANAVLATSPEGADLTRADFGRILPDYAITGANASAGWLNDEAVNAWFASICTRKNEQDGYVKGPNNTPAFVAYSSAWYTSYSKAGGAQNIKNWSRRKGIAGAKLLKAEKIFFPINTGAHWTLLIVSPKDRKIEYLNSMHGSKTRWFKIAREWLKMELGKDYVEAEWTEAEESESATQLNMDDCGVFTCMNGLASAKAREFGEVSATNGMKDARELMAVVLLFGGLRGEWDL